MSMTPDAYVALIPDFHALSASKQTDYLIYFLTELWKAPATSASLLEVRGALRLRPFDVGSYLSRGSRTSRRTKPRLVRTADGFALEVTEQRTLAKMIALRPTAAATAATLRSVGAKLKPGVVRDYLEEAIGCFEAGFNRAAVVVSWTLGYAVLREWVFHQHLAAFNAVTSGWKNPVTLAKSEDFEELKERVVLDTARTARLLSKTEHKVLVALLDDRNTYAHPSGRSISAAKAEAFLQQVTDEMLAKFG